MTKNKQFIFNGYDGLQTFGEGYFTIGKTYDVVEGPDYYPNESECPDAKFIDNSGAEFWEDLKYFTEKTREQDDIK